MQFRRSGRCQGVGREVLCGRGDCYHQDIDDCNHDGDDSNFYGVAMHDRDVDSDAGAGGNTHNDDNAAADDELDGAGCDADVVYFDSFDDNGYDVNGVFDDLS